MTVVRNSPSFLDLEFIYTCMYTHVTLKGRAKAEAVSKTGQFK